MHHCTCPFRNGILFSAFSFLVFFPQRQHRQSATRPLLDIHRRINVAWEFLGQTEYFLSQLAVRKLETLPRAKQYIRSAVGLFRNICPYSERFTKTFEKLLDIPVLVYLQLHRELHSDWKPTSMFSLLLVNSIWHDGFHAGSEYLISPCRPRQHLAAIGRYPHSPAGLQHEGPSVHPHPAVQVDSAAMVTALTYQSRMQDALDAGDKLLDMYRRLNASWIYRSQAKGLLFRAAITKSEFYPKAMQYIRSTVEVFRNICPYSETLTKTYEKLMEHPETNPNYMAIDNEQNMLNFMENNFSTLNL